MEQFYKMLSEYNKGIDFEEEWPLIYTEDEPPVYWKNLANVMNRYDREKMCFEIGSGAGDVISLIMSMGFTNVKGIELNDNLAKIANNKIWYFFNLSDICINAKFPINLNFVVDLLIMVNCVYWENCSTKGEYLNKIQKFYKLCGEPTIFLWEVIDDVEQEGAYPEYVRVSLEDVRSIFLNYYIEKIDTYRWPENTSSKCLYIIEKR